MKIVITTMNDPLVTDDLISYFIENTSHKIEAVFVSNTSQFDDIVSKSSQINFVHPFTLLLIAGPLAASKKAIKAVTSKISTLIFGKSQLQKLCEVNKINYFESKYADQEEIIDFIKSKKVDLVINQSQEILSKNFLKSPRIGVLNRHNSILPHYRGRLAPFWVLKNKEKITGVAIHLIGEKIDRGPLVVQKFLRIGNNETYESLTNKCYKLAKIGLVQAVDRLDCRDVKSFITPVGKGSYFGFPTLKEALKYRFGGIF